ncbi:DUF6214 family protein [Streptomyces sp. NPDC055366]
MVLESPFLGVSDHYRPNADGSPSFSPSFHVRLTFGDGAAIDARAVVSEGRITLEGLHARPPHPADDVPASPDDMAYAHPVAYAHPQEPPAVHRARPAWPRGREGRLMVAREYRTAQAEGRDPVLAVMQATGRSRRRSLRLIAAARDAGTLPPRHNRR